MTDDEKKTILNAANLLENSTSNSLDPADRINWKVLSRIAVRDLREMVR
jgi:hypothetical protein